MTSTHDGDSGVWGALAAQYGTVVFPRKVMNISPPKRFQGDVSASPFQRFTTEKNNHVYHPLNTGVLRSITATGDEFMLNDVKVELVTLVCRVPTVHEGGQRYDLTLADEFGVFKGVVYRSGESAPRAFRNFSPSATSPSDYFSVIGHLRKFQSTPMVLVDLIEPVKSYYDVLSHRASVLWAWCQRTGRAPSRNSQVLRERSTPTNDARDEFSHLQPLQRDIMRAFKRLGMKDSNVHKLDVLNELKPRPMEKEFESQLHFLSLYGYLIDGQSKDTYIPSG